VGFLVCLQGPLHGYELLSALLTTLAVRLPFGAHQSISVDVHRGRDLGVAHQLLLHPNRRSGVVQPRPVGVAEGVPPHAAVLSDCCPPLLMERKPLAVRGRAVARLFSSLPILTIWGRLIIQQRAQRLRHMIFAQLKTK
jgi:hypothetical protein